MTAALKERKDVPKENRWNLSPMFESDDAWEKLYKDLEKEVPRYETFRGKLGNSPELFKEAFEFDLEVSRSLEQLYTYAHLKSDEDTSNQDYLAMYQKVTNLYTRISEVASYMSPEIQALPEETLKGYMKHPDMTEYRFSLEKLMRYKPHTHNEEIERILAMAGEIGQAPSRAFSQLDNADLKFGTITGSDGTEQELSHGSFSSFLINENRDIREKAFFQYYEAYENHKNTMATTLEFSNKKDSAYARIRNFSSSREASLFSDNVPLSVYDNLIETVKNSMEPLFKYLEFRKKVLGLDELHAYDTYVPIVKDIKFHMPYEEAVDTAVEALAPLGAEYTQILKEGLLGGWVDRYENRGKRSGAYSSGSYDSPPYILLNYREDNINSLYTLIHEAGHSMHSWYSVKNQPYINHGYTIFVAEVASTFNETLLSDFLLKKYADDPRMQAWLLNREIDNIRATLYRQTMFAEFEKLTHEATEANQPLTLDVMREMYKGLLKDYFGDVLTLDECLTLEALRIPHFYSAFYVYKYATGISAAIALAESVSKEVKGARDRYLDFLTLGGSMFPLEELQKAGVDMASPEPVKAAIGHFSKLVDELIQTFTKL